MSDHGPFVTKLILAVLAREAIPPGGGIADGIKFFTDSEHRSMLLAKAESEAVAFIQEIKAAPDNYLGNDDEHIAEELLKMIAARVKIMKRMEKER
jgi:hypothetical protein